MNSLHFVLLAVASATGSVRRSQKVTPVEKVMELLTKLSAQVADEGKKQTRDAKTKEPAELADENATINQEIADIDAALRCPQQPACR